MQIRHAIMRRKIHLIMATIIIIIVSVKNVSSVCQQSYMVICDDLLDVEANRTRSEWTELLIEPDRYETNWRRHKLGPKVLSQDLSGLVWLAIVGDLDGIASNAFFHLRNNIHQLVLYGNELATLPRKTVSRFRAAKQISLRANRVEFVDENAFVDSTIDVLDLSDNRIDVIKSRQFSRCRIGELRLRRNRLTQIEPNCLPGTLQKLHLDQNRLATLPDGVLDDLADLAVLTVSQNSISHIFDVSPLKSVQILDYSHNQIHSVVGRFRNLHNLTYLDLSWNNLRQFSFVPILRLNALPKIIKLAYNKLTNLLLPNTDLTSTTITIYGNPWNCRCLEQMEKSLFNTSIIQTTDCDDYAFSNGDFPICVHRETCIEENISEMDVRKFKTSILNCD